MVTYKDILEANKDVKTSDIDGKPYVGVAERVKAFRKVYPTGRIETETKMDGDTCTTIAKIYAPALSISDGFSVLDYCLIATGTAQEKAGVGFVNKRSHVENCETSAIGRALGFAGFGLLDDIASGEEVQNAKLADVSKQKIDGIKVIALKARCKNDGVDEETITKLYKVKTLEDLTERHFENLNQFWDRIVTIKGGKE